MSRYFCIFILSIFCFGLCLACNQNQDETYSDLTDALTRYDEIEIVKFDLSGSAACQDCTERGITPTMLQVEVVPAGDLTHVMAMDILNNLGPFAFQGLKAEPGSTLIIYGELFYGTGEAHLNSSTEVTVPEDEDQTISCIINF
ncbi:MAG: hypothetical protein ABH859_01595 [Pseudomonadota bacterium]